MVQEDQWVKVLYKEKLYIICVILKNMKRRLICICCLQHAYGNGKSQLLDWENVVPDYENVNPTYVIPHTVQVAGKFM